MEPHRPHQAHNGTLRAPLVSVLMASFRAAPYIRHALGSVLGQSLRDLEVIVVDDGSDDGTFEIVEAMAEQDRRIRLLRSAGRGGPAHARNLALDTARGEWLAVVDADDMVHPERFERLLAAASQLAADIIFDDLMQFHEDGSRVAFLLGERVSQPSKISPVQWILAGSRPDLPVLGYLKPIVRARVLRGARYDETLRVGEDYDLVLRLLLDGASAWVIPEPLYFYRKRANSVSHRLSAPDYNAMIESQNRVAGQVGPKAEAVQSAFAQRLRHLQTGLALERLVTAIKCREPLLAARILAGNPMLMPRLGRAMLSGLKRRRRLTQLARQQPSRPSAVRLHLTAGPASGHFPAGVEVIHTPAVGPPGGALNPSANHRTWAEIANRSLGRRVELSWEGAAGRHAAGFILGSVVQRSGDVAAGQPLAEVDPQ